MASDDDIIGQAKREAFGDKADLASTKVVGSGISETTRISLNLHDCLELLDRLPRPWISNAQMIEQLFTPIFSRSGQCPGRGKPQCCQAPEGQFCSPNWRDREDIEWYAQEINKYLSLVNDRLQVDTPVASRLAVDAAFELGPVDIVDSQTT